MIFGGVLSGGTGSRMEKAKMPKQFLPVGGVPVFVRTVKTFLSVTETVFVSVNMDYADLYEKYRNDFSLDKEKVIFVPGGDSRFTSLINLVRAAKEYDEGDNFIITHDCARLFVSCDIIKNNIKALKEYDMVTTAIPVIDTVICSQDGKTEKYVPKRSELWSDQGPQSFRINSFIEYLEKIPKDRYSEYIEAGKLFSENGKKIGIAMGDRYNFKITNDIDLEYAEFLLKKGYVK